MKQSTSITEGPIFPALLSFFFPILLGTLFQQLYNTADAIIVGRFVGKEALAAVGGGTAVFIQLLIGFFVGLASGTGIVISQFYGAKKFGEVNRSVHTTILLGVIGGFIVTVVGIASSPFILHLIGTPDEIFSLSVTYLKIFFSGMIPIFVYNVTSGVLRSVGDSKTPLYILIVSCALNIVLDIVFVVVLKDGVRGAAFATVLSQTISMIVILAYLLNPKKELKDGGCYFKPKNLSLTPHIMGKMLRIGLPTGIQTCFYTLSNLIIQTNINSFGTDTIAAWASYGKIDAVFWMMVSSLGIAVTTFSGQNFGASKIGRIRKSAFVAMGIAIFMTCLCCVLFVFAGNAFLSLFTTDAEVKKIGMGIIRFIAPLWFTYISIEVLSGVLRGTGRSFYPTIITLIGVCLLRLLWLFIAVPFHKTFTMVIASYPITWTVTSICFWIYYFIVFKNKKDAV